MNMHAMPDFLKNAGSAGLSDDIARQQDDATRIALYLAAQIQKEHLELHRQRVAGAIDPVTAHCYLKIKEFIWTATRLLGLAHLHDGTRKRIPAPSHPRNPLGGDDPTCAILDSTSPRLFIDVTPTYRHGGNQGIQRVVREIAKRSMRGEGALPVVIQNGRLAPYFERRAPLPPIEFRKGDKFLILDASWLVTDEYVPIIEKLTAAGGQLVTLVYDLIPLTQPLSVAAPMTDQFKTWFESIVLKSDRILCISRSVADDVVAYISREGARTKPDLRVGWWRLGADFDEQAEKSVSAEAREITADDTPIFLSVGTLEPRKAYPIALEAFDILWRSNVLDARYVIIGRPGWQSEALQRDINDHPELGRRLFWLNDASDADLRHCYEHARGLIFPSMVEGFGLPLVEAGRRGIPVIASDIPVFHEIAGPDVRYFDLLDPVDLAHEILRLSREAPMRGEASYLTWDDAADALLELVTRDAYQARIVGAASAPGLAAHGR